MAACYHPTLAPDQPCSPAGACPRGQVCDTKQAPPLCVEPGDGGMDAMTPLGCRADSDCMAGACHELDGTCVTEAEILFATPDGDPFAACTRDKPCTLGGAIGKATADRHFIRVADGEYNAALSVGASVPTILSGERADSDGARITAPTLAASILALDSTGTLVVEGLTLHDSPLDGIASRGTLTLYRVRIAASHRTGLDQRQALATVIESRIEGSAGQGVYMPGVNGPMGVGGIDLERSVVIGNAGGGMRIAGAITLANSAIVANGTGTAGTGGVTISQSSTAALRFLTIADNAAATDSNAALECANATVLEDSIVANNVGAQAQLGAGCSARFTLFTGAAAMGEGNLVGPPGFMGFGDYHLAASSLAVDAADPSATEALDIDGEARPSGLRRDLGADERH